MAIPAPAYLVDNLVESCFLKYVIPSAQVTFTNQQVTDLLDEELRSTIVPFINSVHGEYWVTNFDQPIVQGQNTYTVPQRTAAGVLRDLVLVDANNNEYNVALLSPAQAKFSANWITPTNYGAGFSYYMQDDKAVLLPLSVSPPTAYTLRMKEIRRPNNLTLSSNCGQVTSIDRTNVNAPVVALSNVSSDWTTSTTFDIIQNFPQFNSIIDGVGVTALSGLNVTFDDPLADLTVGMWVCPTLMSCIPQIPYEVFPYLVERGILRMVQSIVDNALIPIVEKRCKELKDALTSLLEPRVQGSPKVIINPNNRTNWSGAYPGRRF